MMNEHLTEAYNRGKRDSLSNKPEPVCPFGVNTPEYTSYAEGFCHRIPEIVNSWRAKCKNETSF